ncbi:MAG: heavy-metal-associated domain-containing protein [Clostridia bacterium]|nr:heavy-metal-associated domain-containing protein [Clostridia bacterium]
MELMFNVEGMMCGGCENRVKTALGEIEGVKEVIANHENGTVKVTLENEIDREILVEAIENLGFDVKED